MLSFTLDAFYVNSSGSVGCDTLVYVIHEYDDITVVKHFIIHRANYLGVTKKYIASSSSSIVRNAFV